MPIGTVYRAPTRATPQRKRSSTGLGALSGESGPASPTSPSLPVVGGGPSDLEARIAEELHMQRARPASAPSPAPPAPFAPSPRTPEPSSRTPQAAPAPAAVFATSSSAHAAPAAATAPAPTKILILYYSMYGHVRLLADSIRVGVESVPGCTAEIFRVPETLGTEVLKKMNAPLKHSDSELTYDMLHKLREADGIMFGIPTRFGMMPAQMKSLFDSTVKLWTKGDLVGKPGGLFFSSATQGGGQETTALTTITQLVHHGMIYVPPGYSFGGAMFDNSEVHGGSPYGCGTIANGDGSRLPSKYELDFAKHQGAQFALVALKLAQ